MMRANYKDAYLAAVDKAEKDVQAAAYKASRPNAGKPERDALTAAKKKLEAVKVDPFSDQKSVVYGAISFSQLKTDNFGDMRINKAKVVSVDKHSTTITVAYTDQDSNGRKLLVDRTIILAGDFGIAASVDKPFSYNGAVYVVGQAKIDGKDAPILRRVVITPNDIK